MNLATLDIAILVIYAIGIFALAQWVSREKGEHKKDAQDYFLASRALPWWAIGTSLIAANISAEGIATPSATKVDDAGSVCAETSVPCSSSDGAAASLPPPARSL